MIKHNPFVSSNFAAIWRRHFTKGKKELMFSEISTLHFIKYPKLPLYTNLGGKNTKGLSYTLSPDTSNDFKSSVLLFYDIHGYFQEALPTLKYPLKLKKIVQYPGFLCDLEGINSVQDYMQKTLSKKSKYRFNLYKRKLEHSFEISYTMFYGDMTKATYDFLFDTFYILLRKRFDAKQEVNNNLHPEEWNFYQELSYPLILEKKAALFVTYDQDKPIAISLLFFSDSIAFDTIRVFDIDYATFRLGTTSIMKQLEWCIEQKFKYLDFSKGDYEYKNRWATIRYSFEYHLLYDSNSLKASLLVNGISFYFITKQYLRDLKLHIRFHQLMHRLKNLDGQKNSLTKPQFKATSSAIRWDNYTAISIYSLKETYLRKTLFDFLYQKSEKLSDLQLFRSKTVATSFVIKGKKNTAIFTIPQDN